MQKKLSRRSFLKGSIAGAASLAAMGILGGCSNEEAGTTTAVGNEVETTQAPVMETKAITYADTICWNGEFDVIVVGSGAAGLTSAITAADAGARVLIVEKAPKGAAGGNSKVCHQLFATVDTVEGGMEYYSSMRGNFKSTSDEVLKAYVTGMTGLRDYLASLGADKEKMTCWRGCGIATYDCEHPELAGSEHFFAYTLTDKVEDGALYSLLRKNVKDRAASIDVYYETPAMHLIQDPVSKAIIGVTVERAGETLNLRALNGVIMACGGFENNEEMLENYLYLGGQYHHYGTDYNTGDGIKMAMEVGANLWHMANYEATGVSNMYPAPGEDLFYMLAGNPAYGA
ncbi:MAG: FAD-dependent oxidoreductase, partial [Lachnospiraceae bacterium]|nr:FAD-dependent oxidoreductase [Lachnospiraceae bacterium]